MNFKNILQVLSMVLMLILTNSAFAATQITATNLDTLALGELVAGPITDDFLSAPPNSRDIGDLGNSVYYNAENGIYTYTHTVEPDVDNISEFNTGFLVAGFNGIAGYSFSDTASQGGNGDSSDFDVFLDSDGSIDWEAAGEFFDAGGLVTFFFQSTLPPDAIGDYNLINSVVGTAQSFAPVPAPAALPAGLIMLAALGFRQIRRRTRIS